MKRKITRTDLSLLHIPMILSAAVVFWLMLLRNRYSGFTGVQQPVPALILLFAVLAGLVSLRWFAAGRLQFRTGFARLSLAAFGATALSIASGMAVGLLPAGKLCASWPLCPPLIPGSPAGWLHMGHRLMVALNAILVLGLVTNAWRTQRFQRQILLLSTLTAVLFLAQSGIGAALAARAPASDLVLLHAATAAALWVMVVLLVFVVGWSARTPEAERLDAFQRQDLSTRARDFLALTKPVIVLLLLITTLTGMIVGARGLPPGATLFWTLLAGAMAAGGSGAINQYIDRKLDKKMRRTARRPLASGRMTPAEGLAFGVGLCLASFYLLAVFANMLAAWLAVLGMIYYVWIYSILLKNTTDQNIVIGGGAGAVPPLVGWAAATGSLSVPAWMLFAIIFFWTPPHFWALALVRVRDYARGGVPMLPVVRGQDETLRHILAYSLFLVLLTLLAPLVGLGGVLYLLGAALLGGALVWTAWRLRRSYSSRRAWKMYRFSSLYLALLFLILVADVFIPL